MEATNLLAKRSSEPAVMVHADYCTNLYEDSETERCWLAYNYFEERKKAAEEGCTLEVGAAWRRA